MVAPIMGVYCNADFIIFKKYTDNSLLEFSHF